MRQVLGASLISTLAFALWGSSGCGSDAVGIDECRRIEEARCSAAEACGYLSDIKACERFYRDQCLHGLSVPTPGRIDVEACVEAIGAAENCARETDPACVDAATKDLACELVRHPELASECSFLGPSSRPESEGSGGRSGTGGGESGPSSPTAGAGGVPAE